MSTEAIEGAAPVAPVVETAAQVVEEAKSAAGVEEKPAVDDNRIPLHRFNEVNEAKKQAVVLREAAEAQALEATTALEALRAELAESQTTAQQALERSQREGATFRAGVTKDDHVDTVLYKYSKVQADAEGNKPAYSEWLAGYVAENPYLRGAPATRAPIDNGNGGAKPVAPKSALSREAIAAMTTKEYAALRGFKKS